MPGRLHDKIAVVTGGSRGIGRAIIEKFIAEGATVTNVDLSWTGVALAPFCRADVTRESDVRAAMDDVRNTYGRIDILVNNAGVNAYFNAETMTEAEWESVFAVDLKGAWLCAKHVLTGMKERRSGSIVNIASIHAQATMAGMFPYAAAKSGLVGLTRSLALDYAAQGIRVNAVSPGWTRTDLVEEWFRMQEDPAAAEASVVQAHPMHRIARPIEVANLVAFVASDEASAITGASLAVDCGLGVKFAI
ncbi:MAG TPA: SDR family oxidoreductase [Vicinamibacterales bacterium]|nr:SDR family oxidoreductase [Vicinamibacterales bacterium]